MEQIVLGYDGSPAAVAALSWTAGRAARAMTKVDVVHVAPPHAQDRSGALELLAGADAVLRGRVPGLEVELHSLRGGMPESIAEFASDADLVVIGINPGHPLRAAAAGWMPLRLSIHSPVPVCVVPAGWVDRDDPVTVGIVDDSSSDSAFRAGVAEAVATSRPLRLVHAWLMPTPSFDESTALRAAPTAVMEEHQRILDTAVEQVMGQHPTLVVRSELVRDSRSAALLRFAPVSSLLVIGTHHRGVLVGGLLGSVAQEILWRAECPICIVPPSMNGRPADPRTAGYAAVE